MAAFDTPLTPTSSAPADTNAAALFTATAATTALVDVANIGSGAIAVRVGITPSGGSVHWKTYDVTVAVGDSLLALGPWFLESGDAVTVRTDTADDAVFSITGLESS